MSALRLGRLPDGTRHIVEDPTFTVGRVSFSRVGMRASGEYIVATQARKEPNRSPDPRTGAHKKRGEALVGQPQQRDDLAGVLRPTCGKVMKIAGEPCARKPGHGFECKSRAALETAADKRRSTRVPLRPGFCGEWMPEAGEPCARRLGHTTHHSSSTAVENDKARALRRSA